MFFFPQGTTDYIYCKDGHCQFVTQVKLEQNKMFEMRRFFLCLDSVPQLEIYHGITFQNYADRLQAGSSSELAKENSGKKKPQI